MKKIILVGIIFAFLGVLGVTATVQAHKCEENCQPTPTPTPKVYHCYEDCVTPTPTIYQNPTPSVTPTATPSAQPSGNVGSGSSGCGNNCSASAPGPAYCGTPFAAPILQGFTVDGNGSVTFSWWGVPTDKYSIVYGYAPDKLVYGADNIPSSSTSFQINGLTPGKSVWAVVSSWRAGCESKSKELDPVVE